MALTKSAEEVDPWLETAQDTIRKGAYKNVSPNYEHILHIDHALTSETAHDGTEIIVELLSKETEENEFWATLTSFLMGSGTAASEVIDDNPLAALASTITISDTTGFEVEGTKYFLKDITDIENSELIRENGFTNNTNITLIDPVTRAHVLNSVLYNIAESRVIQIPFGALGVRVLYNNSFDSGGSTIATRSRLTKVTGV